jgi:hypothetical protein
MHVVQGKDELAQLIERALALSDENDLSLVSIHLEAARLALAAEPDASVRLSPREKLTTFEPKPKPACDIGRENVIKLHPPGSLEQLLSEHEALEIRRRCLLELADGTPNPVEAARQLAEFALLIEGHRATERRCVYAPLLVHKIDVSPLLNKKIEGLVGEMEQDWASYLHSWDQEKIARRWKEFCVVTQSILVRAGERMRLEERVIYPLAFMGGMIELGEPTD